MLQTSATVPDWTADPRVVRILTSFAKHPPRRVNIPPVDRWTTATTGYAGYRVECLFRLWTEIAASVIERCYATGDYQPWTDFCCQPMVDEAISRAALEPDLDTIYAEVLVDAREQFRGLLGLAA